MSTSEPVFALAFPSRKAAVASVGRPTYRENALVPRGKWQQSDVARLFDGAGQPPLVCGADTGQAAGNNLPPLRDELLQQPNIAVVDRVDLLHAELADLFAPEELASSGTARSTGATGTAPARAASTSGTVSCWSIRTIPCWSIRTVARWTLCCRTLSARCCCCCAGLFSHGFLLLSSRPAFVFSRRNRPCCQLLCVDRTGCDDAGAWPALISAAVL
jgi:hypothetical protein